MIETVRSRFHVVELRSRPELLDQVAAWHQGAWQQQDLPQRKERLRDHLGPSSLPTTLLGMWDEQPVGSVSLVRYQKLGGFEASVWLANVFVRPDYRQRGIGADLMSAAADFAAGLGLSPLYLYTYDHEQYYRALGWQTLKRHSFSGRPVTIMQLALPVNS